MRTRASILAGAMLLSAPAAFAQTNPTGTISGKVVDQQGLAVPGVAVGVESPTLQGTRTATTSANGDYIFPFLTPGDYTVTFELAGFATVKQQNVRVAAGGAVPLGATMVVSVASESVTVVGETAQDFGQSSQASTNFTQRFVDSLPLARTLQATVQLAPGVQATGPNGAVSISGAASFENVFMVNGVVIMDNIRATPLDLYIEDALQETTITTASVSAEYGRFGGGVVNALTRSGGNEFSGSFRTTFDNDKWVALTPFANDRRLDDVIPIHEATLGGPFVKDKLWFFGATRLRDRVQSFSTTATNIPFDRQRDEKRYEGKLTYSLNPSHTLKGSYSHIAFKENGNFFGTILDLESLVNRETPQDLLSLNYTGILSPRFFVEAQYSLRKFTFVGSGSQFTDLIQGTMLRDQSRNLARFNSPTFCGVCDDEKRDNSNYVVKASYFLSTGSLGSHNLVGGLDVFDDERFANNHQSGSDFRVHATSAIVGGTQVFPVFDSRTFIRWTPIFASTQGNRFRTISAFVNDAWSLDKHWSFNLGARYDKNDGADSLGNAVVKDSAVSPRVAVTFDPKGDGTWTVNAGYAKYVAAIANAIGDSASAGGQPATIDFDYLGPSVNTGNPADPVSSAEALRVLFDWFNANGGTDRATRGAPVIPGVTARIGERLSSPNVQELTLGFTRRLGSRGLFRLDGVHREYRDFYAFQLDLSTGRNADQFGRVFDLGITVNTDRVERTYNGLNLQGNYRVTDRLNLGGNYTYGHLEGSFNGESGGGGPAQASILGNPEYFDPAWSGGPNTTLTADSSGAGPVGDLLADVRHKARFYAVWDLPLPAAAGSFSLSALQYLSTGTPYGALGGVDTRPYVTNPGYVNPPASVDYYFTSRDAFRMDTLHRTDVALNWAHRLGLKKAEIFFRGTVQNLFDRQKVTNFFDPDCGTGGCISTTVQTNRNVSTLARFNPFTETPVEGVNWRRAATFGQPTSRFAYQTPRTYQFSVGFRF